MAEVDGRRGGHPQSKEILDSDHYDLEKVKDRILDYLSVRQLKPSMKGPILCFVGPPGVGKTSLGKSIARALGRKFVRMSLGGMHDEAEIRGHRRTYIGALPGQIIQGIRRAETNDPVFMLDEIDKVGRDFRGDPGSALAGSAGSGAELHLPRQLPGRAVRFVESAVHHHRQHAGPIAEPLRDRMEIIELQGYTEEEKVHIAFQYLVPRQIEENGITGDQIEFPEETIRFIIRHYTREAGVRNLERTIGTICRKQARRIAEGKTDKLKVTPEVVQHHDMLGGIEDPHRRRNCRAHQALGRGRGPGMDAGRRRRAVRRSQQDEGQGRLHHDRTARPGDAGIDAGRADLGAVQRQGAWASTKNSSPDHDIHIHVPAGAIPKDGPSAGVTMVTALVSLLTDKPVRPLTAMTGEITLSGNVLPIGGIKEKALAAKRAGVTDIILPADNQQNVQEDLTPEQLQGLNLHYVKTIEELLDIALPSTRDEVKKDAEIREQVLQTVS